nr:Os02g0184300 [Ipomoea batatas]
MPTVIRAVEIMSCFFNAGSISFTALTSKKSVAKRVVNKQTRMPMELTRRGYSIAVNSWLMPKEDIEATTRAAQDDSAYEPNKSDPIPAISPTLSPTFSNISSFCIYTPTHSTKEGHRRSTKPITSDRLKQAFPVITIVQLEQIDGNVQDQKTISSKKETHNCTRPKCSDESLPNTLSGLQGSPGICISCYFHSEKARNYGSNSTKQEGYGTEDSSGKCRLARFGAVIGARLVLCTETLNRAQENKDQNSKSNHKNTNILVFSEKERGCTCNIHKLGN